MLCNNFAQQLCLTPKDNDLVFVAADVLPSELLKVKIFSASWGGEVTGTKDLDLNQGHLESYWMTKFNLFMYLLSMLRSTNFSHNWVIVFNYDGFYQEITHLIGVTHIETSTR